MSKIISDDFWNCMKDLFSNNKGKAGRPPISARKALSGIMFVLENGSKWRFLPRIYGKPSTVHGTFMRWVRNGTFKAIVDRSRQFYLANLSETPKWCAIDTSSSKAPFANWAGKSPVDRSKHGIKKSIIVDLNGAPLALAVGAANRHDSIFVKETLDDIVKLETNCFKILAADSAYDSKRLRTLAKKRGFVLYSAINKRRSRDYKRIKPSFRWKVEASHSWLNNFRSLKTCWTKTKEAFVALLQLGASVVLFRKGIIFG
jgi:putative transposase